MILENDGALYRRKPLNPLYVLSLLQIAYGGLLISVQVCMSNTVNVLKINLYGLFLFRYYRKCILTSVITVVVTLTVQVCKQLLEWSSFLLEQS